MKLLGVENQHLEKKMTNYLKYRGKCKELCEELTQTQSGLELVRGYYYDAFWGKQTHWWCKDEFGNILDPSKKQFPDQNGEYEEFDGWIECSNCSKKLHENDQGIIFQSNYVFCDGTCYIKFVL